MITFGNEYGLFLWSIINLKKIRRAGGMAQAVVCLPKKHKILGRLR
jgi:hypothetical protein